MSQGEKAAVIQDLVKEGHRLADLLKISELPKSTYYYEIKKNNAISKKDTDLIEIIKDIFNENKGRYGVRRVYYEIKNRGITVNHKRVQRIMHSLKLFGKRPKEKYHSYKGEIGKTADNIINRNFKADAPYEKITTDVSQFNFSWGKCYLSPVIDMYSNEVLGYDLSLNPNLVQISHMLDMTFSNMPHTKDTIFHSDYAEEKTIPKFCLRQA
ncbi:MAG: IS3 family transposase [Floccifex porci]|uniref:IS3 family transposase n=1 Tax=Floccifex porci TaxID=2606629 RepID=UPI002A83C76C|nr:IS3 family transposase [Floccifex porci]MDY4796298.1 IS3 family transposase [Floccifex porci]